MFEKLLRTIGNTAAGKAPALDKDTIAELLRTTPEALDAFESAYAARNMNEESTDIFHINSRQAAALNHERALPDAKPADFAYAKGLQERIVGELLAKTPVYFFDGNLDKMVRPRVLPDGYHPVTNDEIQALPEDMRPQLAGNLMTSDITGLSCPGVLFYYDMYLNSEDPKKRKFAYDHFRQGLDILDLDPVTYEIIGTNRNSIGHWLPQLVEACRGQEFFRIPATAVAKVPLPLLQLTRLEYSALSPATLSIVDAWTREAFHLDGSKEYFVKTGTYSSKYDFRNCHVRGEKEVRELGEYLLFVHFQALQMASPLAQPTIYGASTTNEWAVREFIPDKERNPCIYEGMPLHTEYRVFVDCDTDEVLTIVPYWDPETMKQRLGREDDAATPQKLHDYVIYKAHEETLMRRYHANKDAVASHIREILPALDLHGQWSIDVMQNGGDFWLIDMAVAENSSFYNRVPLGLRRPSTENWIPQVISTSKSAMEHH